MAEKLKELALGYSLGIVSAACMLLFGLLGSFGYYGMNGMYGMMQGYMFSLTPTGIILGAIEAGIIGLIAGYAIALIYNKFA